MMIRRRGRSARVGAALALALSVAAGSGGAIAADPLQPPLGRWRCYQPPKYEVTAWFDLDVNNTVRVNGGDAMPFSIRAGQGVIAWSNRAFGDLRFGRYLPPRSDGADAARHTIVLARQPDLRPERPDWARLQRCYLTTH